jgi:hypothetical protein
MRTEDRDIAEPKEIPLSVLAMPWEIWSVENEDYPSHLDTRVMLLAKPGDSIATIIKLDSRRVLALLSDSSGSP